MLDAFLRRAFPIPGHILSTNGAVVAELSGIVSLQSFTPERAFTNIKTLRGGCILADLCDKYNRLDVQDLPVALQTGPEPSTSGVKKSFTKSSKT